MGGGDGPAGPWGAVGLAAPSRVSSRALSLPPSHPKMVAVSSRTWRPTGPSAPAGSGAAAPPRAPSAPGAARPCGPRGVLPAQRGRAAGFPLRINTGHLRAVCATRGGGGGGARPTALGGAEVPLAAAPPVLPRGRPWCEGVGAPGLGWWGEFLKDFVRLAGENE